ncbi:MAG: hypothetical protein K0Q55_306 [Verrucomicrobia bacterium]|jgi:hypothetical protein|nr:hypothetical protein [Verrucomicrobiota bacterium]
MRPHNLTPREKLILSLCIVFFVSTCWLFWSYATLKIQTKFAQEQIAYFTEMSNRSLAGNPAQAAECLAYVVNYYPSGTKQTRGSALDDLVERQRERAQQEIIAILRARTRDDLGQKPEPWIKKYRKETKPASPRSAATFQNILSQAATRQAKGEFKPSIPNDLTAAELAALVTLLKQHAWDLEKYGDQGITVLEQNLVHALYVCSRLPDGAHLVTLLQDDSLIWDAAHSLTISDAILQCGPKALPQLKKLEAHSSIAQRCIKMIQSGQKTAF